MKKLLSISFALLILLSGMNLTIAIHYCGNEIAASKISVSGELASCGMEVPMDNCSSPVKHIENECCENNLTVLAVDHNYAPSFTEFKTFSPLLLQVFLIPANFSILSLSTIYLNSTSTSPQGNLLVQAVSLPKICVFLI